MATHHARISRTAKLVAHLRAGTDIPYCPQIAEMCDSETISAEFFNGDPGQVESRRALLELRFKSLNAFLYRLGANRVLELAGGVAPRGLILSEDPKMFFVETDLPEIIEEKWRIVDSLVPLTERPNYKLRPANALHLKELLKAADSFKQGPITIVHEGLLQYLDASEKKQLAGNIRILLEDFGGVWITPDIVTREYFERFYRDPERASMVQKVADATGRNIMDNCFADRDNAIEFFRQGGFICQQFKQVDLVPEIRNHLTDPRILERIEYEPIWMMQLSE